MGSGRQLIGAARDLLDLLREWRAVNGNPEGSKIAGKARVSASYVSEIFSGRKVPSPDKANAIVRSAQMKRSHRQGFSQIGLGQCAWGRRAR